MLSLMLAARLPPWERPGRVLLYVVAGFGLATIGFGLSRNLAFSLVCLFLIGATDSISMVIRQTLMQALTPDQLRGRVASVSSLFVSFSNELGAFESGAVAGLFGPVDRGRQRRRRDDDRGGDGGAAVAGAAPDAAAARPPAGRVRAATGPGACTGAGARPAGA